ncbi:4401_t:CDS:2 [Paraglomus occultum]|uniref:4401_t:CDS:1 n=1 Tax=Paraglomus occultum TaxID=144539 RepID=A0A9N9B096_9GLOM|nr:4401_t:CDS:2 [Paraglomus occultum]
MSNPRPSRGRPKRTSVTPTRQSPRKVRRVQSYLNAVNRHFVNTVPILEVTLRFDEDEYDVWRRQDTDEVNLYYMLRIKYPKDADEATWRRELEKLKKEIGQIRVVNEGWFEGVWISLEKAKEIARRYDIYDLVAELLETENSWFDSPKNKPKDKSLYTREKDSQNTQNAMPPPDPIIPNGEPQSNTNYEKKPCNHRSMAEQADVSSQAEYKNQITILKQKIDESEQFLQPSQSKKRRLYWTAGGFAVGAVAATAVGLLAGDDMREMLNGMSESVSGMIQF